MIRNPTIIRRIITESVAVTVTLFWEKVLEKYTFFYKNWRIKRRFRDEETLLCSFYFQISTLFLCFSNNILPHVEKCFAEWFFSSTRYCQRRHGDSIPAFCLASTSVPFDNHFSTESIGLPTISVMKRRRKTTVITFHNEQNKECVIHEEKRCFKRF